MHFHYNISPSRYSSDLSHYISIQTGTYYLFELKKIKNKKRDRSYNLEEPVNSGSLLWQCFKGRDSVLKFNSMQRGTTLLDSTSCLLLKRTTSFQHGEYMIVQPPCFLHCFQQCFPSLV